MENEYSNREIDRMFNEISQALNRIEEQTIRTNGRVTRLEKICLVIGVAVATYLVFNAPELIAAIKIFI